MSKKLLKKKIVWRCRIKYYLKYNQSQRVEVRTSSIVRVELAKLLKIR